MPQSLQGARSYPNPRGDGESWTFESGVHGMRVVRNGIPQYAFDTDARGRLTGLHY